MKSRSTIVLIGLALLAIAVPVIRGEGTGPEALIGRARTVVMTPDPGRDAITRALVDALDAALLILPKADKTKESRSLIEGIKEVVARGEMLSGKAYEDLGLAYKTVSGGKVWTIPEEIKAAAEPKTGIDQAIKICVKLLDSALAAYKAGRSEEAARDLLSMVILVVTPIEASR